MKQYLEKIEILTKKIFENSVNVSRYKVRNSGSKFIIRIYNGYNKIVFGMEGNYNNVKHVCELILKEQETNGGKLYEQQ